MAIERDPGQTRETTTPPPATQPDPEIQRLRQAAQEAEALRGQLNQVAQMVQEGKLVLKQPEAKPPEPEDDSALIDRRELKRAVDEIKTQAANVIVQTTAQGAQQMRVFAKDSVRSKLKNFDKYEGEIDALLDKIPDPRVAAAPETITQVHRIVRANHHDEEVEEAATAKLEEWKEKQRARGWTEDEIEEAAEEREETFREEAEAATPATRGGTGPARPVARSTGVAPAGNASGARLAASRTRAAIPPLTPEQKIVAAEFGMTAEEWHRYGDKSWKPDTFGFHGKRRI